jgi:hypothetical protein
MKMQQLPLLIIKNAAAFITNQWLQIALRKLLAFNYIAKGKFPPFKTHIASSIFKLQIDLSNFLGMPYCHDQQICIRDENTLTYFTGMNNNPITVA